MARPMPRAPPVTSATRPPSSLIARPGPGRRRRAGVRRRASLAAHARQLVAHNLHPHRGLRKPDVGGQQGHERLELLGGGAVVDRPADVSTQALVDAALRDQGGDDDQAAVAEAEAVVGPGAAGSVDRLQPEPLAEPAREPGRAPRRGRCRTGSRRSRGRAGSGRPRPQSTATRPGLRPVGPGPGRRSAEPPGTRSARMAPCPLLPPPLVARGEPDPDTLQQAERVRRAVGQGAPRRARARAGRRLHRARGGEGRLRRARGRRAPR